jgi:hypothetical protein
VGRNRAGVSFRYKPTLLGRVNYSVPLAVFRLEPVQFIRNYWSISFVVRAALIRSSIA